MKSHQEILERSKKDAESARRCKKFGLHLQKETILLLSGTELDQIGGGGQDCSHTPSPIAR